MTVVIPQQQRGPGLIDTGDQTITGVLGTPGNTDTFYVITALMRAQDAADASLTITGLTMYLDGQPVYGPNDWQGGFTDRAGNPVVPQASYSDGLVHSTVRVTVNLPVRMNFGIDVSGTSRTRA